MQLKASIQKEIKELIRRKTLLIFIIGLLFFAFLDPGILKATESIMQQYSTIQQDDSSNQITPEIEITTQAFSYDSVTVHAGFLNDASGMGLLAMLLAMMNTAGGEQKKRKPVIPICSGMNRKTYIYGKYVVFIILTILAAAVFFYVGYGFTNLLFQDGIYKLQYTLIPVIAFILYLLYNVCLMLMLGSITGQGGLSALFIFLFNTVISLVVTLAEKFDYHPYGLFQYFTPQLELAAADYIWKFAATSSITVALCIVFAGVASHIFSKKRLI